MVDSSNVKGTPNSLGALEGWRKLQRRIHHKNNYWQTPDFKIE